jgi:signal transduction histidine kinase
MKDEDKNRKQLIKEKEFAEALCQVGVALNSTLNYVEVLDRILEVLGRVVPHDTSSIMLIENNIVRDFRWYGYEQFGQEDQLASVTFNISDTPNLRTMQETHQPLLIASTENYEGWKPRVGGGWSKSYLGAPIRVRDQVIGFLNVDSTTPEYFSQADAEHLLAFADQVGIAIENARLYSEARQEIAERKRAEATLRHYQEHLEELVAERTTELQLRNEELDAFAHTVAHDLKNPIGVLMGMAEILATDHATLPPDTLSEYLQSIAQSGRKANTIIDELLLLAGLRQQKAQITPLNTAEILPEVLLRLKQMIGDYQAEIFFPEVWPVALGYAPWVEEVWVNYLSNGLKYGGRPPQLELGATRQADGLVRFWVRDNGPGLTSEEQTKLFRPFTRLQVSEVKGHGLGLSIVKRIVEKLGGQVGVSSPGKPERGSVFYFCLPGPEQVPGETSSSK